MERELLGIMRLNLKEGHAEIRHTETGAEHTEEILGHPKMAEAQRPPQFKKMAKESGLGDVYNTLYGWMSMLAHGTAIKIFVDPNLNLRSLMSAHLHSVSALLKCMHLIVVNRIRESRVTKIEELKAILKPTSVKRQVRGTG
jgi:hypothetical protein